MSNDASSVGRPEKLDQLIANYLRAVALGMPVDRQALLAQHPDLADHLRAFFAAQDQVGIAGQASSGPIIPPQASGPVDRLALSSLDETHSLRSDCM